MRFSYFTRMTLCLLGSAGFLATVAIAGDEMVSVKGGSFAFGPDKKKITVKSFMIDRTEVTNAAYQKVVKDHAIPDGKGDHPVVEVSYFDAEAYCKAVGKRLPTGAEWEAAARGADGRAYPWGNTFDATLANTLESGRDSTVAAGSLKGGASPSGALDMAGNVWEWVDEYSDDTKQYRVLKGGSFFDDSGKARTFSTLKSIPDDIHTYSGFRCAK